MTHKGTTRLESKYKHPKPIFSVAVKKALNEGEDFSVEMIEPDLYQSVFPTPLASKSQLHHTLADAWEYVALVILGKDNE